MKNLKIISMLSLLVALSCSTETDHQKTITDKSEPLVGWREGGGTLGDGHNAFITWLYENSWDSMHIYNTDSLLYKFIHRKAKVYFGHSIANLKPILLNGNSWTLISETSFDDFAEITDELTSTERNVLNTIFDEIYNYHLEDEGDVADLMTYYGNAYEDLSESSYTHKAIMMDAVDVLMHSTQLWIDIYVDENNNPEQFSGCLALMILADGYAAGSLCSPTCMEENLGNTYTNTDRLLCVASYSLATYNACH